MQKVVILLASLILLHASCGKKKSQETPTAPQDLSETIVGKWQAQWEMTGKDAQDYAPTQRKMAGEMNFMESGEVKVTSYGFDGCIFMADTSVNTMNWRIENRVLRFMDKKDLHGIPYSIEELENDKIKLSIMEDIHLTLTR